jgi:protein-S-isoprenylcysteine O-methyltransferase Ste14
VLVVVNSVIVIAFGLTFFHPRSRRDWRAMGLYSGFVALFSEMYGSPLTIFPLSGWLGSRFPQLVPTHSGGHLLNDLTGWTGDPHMSPFHLARYAVLIAGFWLVSSARHVLWVALSAGHLAADGAYRRIRHPQYAAWRCPRSGRCCSGSAASGTRTPRVRRGSSRGWDGGRRCPARREPSRHTVEADGPRRHAGRRVPAGRAGKPGPGSPSGWVLLASTIGSNLAWSILRPDGRTQRRHTEV